MTALIISKKELDNIIKAAKSHEESCLLLKDVSKTIKNYVKEQNSGLFYILPGTLGVA